MKSKTMFASSVCCSEWFEELAPTARLLYYQLGFETNTIGEIVRLFKVAALYGFSDDDVRALIEAGLIVSVDSRYFIRHHFVHNRNANEAQRSAAKAAFDDVLGLDFEGEAFKSAYKVTSNGLSDSSTTVRLTVGAKAIQGKEELNAEQFNSSSIKEQPACPECGSSDLETTPGGLLLCPECAKIIRRAS